MSVSRKIAGRVVIKWVSRFGTVGVNLVLIPVLFGHLTKEELGLWFLLGQSSAFVGLMNFGFGRIFVRSLSQAVGRAESGRPGAKQELADLITTGKAAYQLLGPLAFALTCATGIFLLRQINPQATSLHTVYAAWVIICVSQAAAVWSMLWLRVLEGTGYSSWGLFLPPVLQILTLLTEIVVVILGGRLLALAVTFAAGNVAQRIGSAVLVRRVSPWLFETPGVRRMSLLKPLIRPSLLAWCGSLGMFAVMKTDEYFIALVRTAGDIPAYHAMYQIVSNIEVLTQTFSGAAFSFVGQLWESGQVAEIRRVVIRNFRAALIMTSIGSACLMVFGRDLISIWIGPANFIGYPILLAFCLTIVIKSTQAMFATSALAMKLDNIYPLALVAGLINVGLSWWWIHAIGLLGVALATAVSLATTIMFVAVRRGLQRMCLSALALVLRTIVPALVLAGATYGLVFVVVRILFANAGPIGRVATGGVVGGLCFLAAMFGWVLSASERSTIMAGVRRFLTPRPAK